MNAKYFKGFHVSGSSFLRVRENAFQVYDVYCKLILGHMCRITIIFGTMKDGSLLITSLSQTIVLATETSSKMA